MKKRSVIPLLIGLASCLGWLNPSGRDAYAQYYCSLSCHATVPATGTVGVPVSMSASANTLYCEGVPSYSWAFGEGSANASQQSPSYTYTAPGTYNWSVTVSVDDATCTQSGKITISAAASTLATVSAASFSGAGLASESIASAFGTNLATATTSAATVPLPTDLAGTTVKVKDSQGAERLAPLFFVSAGQVNYLIPPGTAVGAATVTVTGGGGAVASGTIQVAGVAPGLFTFTSDGRGVPAGIALRYRNNQPQPEEPIFQLDAQNRMSARPLDLGPDTDLVFLVLFGTGCRYRSSLSAVTATIGGVNAPVDFAGEQGGFVGLDQINIRLPRSLAGRGDVDIVLTVDGKVANTVRVNIK